MITIYGLDYCPYSKEAIELMKNKDLKFKMNWVTSETKEKYKKKHKMDTFPQIFIGRKKIGGLSDLEELIEISEDVIEFEICPKLVTLMVRTLKK